MPRSIVTKIYEADGATLVRTLETDRGRKWLDDSAPGPGSFTIETALDDAETADLTYGRIARFFVDGTARWQGVIEPANQTSAAAARKAARKVVASGRGVLSMLELAELYPEIGIGKVTDSQNRYFNPASLDYVEGVAWVPATELKVQSALTLPWLLDDGGTAPKAWPDDTAFFIGAAGDDTPGLAAAVRHYRKTFAVAAADVGEYRFFMTADDGFLPYLDGDRRQGEARAGLWAETRYFDAYLDEGDHVLYVRHENFDRPDNSTNVAGFICSVMKIGAGGSSYPSVLFHSDSSWSVLADPAAEPGMTPGKVLKVPFDEAQARGALVGWTLGFTDLVDSAGTPWPFEIDVAFPVGTSLFEIGSKLVAEGAVELSVDPDALVLHAWVTRGADLSATVALELGPAAGANIGELDHTRIPPGRNAALARTADSRYVEVVDAAAVLAYGRREGFVSLGGAPTVDAGIRQATAWVDGQKNPDEAITGARVEIVPGGPAPWVDYNVADYVTAPAMDGTAAVYRLRSLAVEEDAAGHPIFRPELGTRLRREAIEAIGRAVTSMNPGAGAGTFDAVSPTGELGELRSLPSSDFIGDEDAVFSTEGLWTDADVLSGPWPVDLEGVAYQVMVSMETVASDDLVFDVLVAGTSVETFTVPAGSGDVTAAWVGDFTVEEPVAAGDGVEIQKISGGTAADKVTIKVRIRSTHSIRGPVGPPGLNGKTLRSGAGAPAAGLGVDGDFYIDTTAWEIYGPKAGGAWGAGTPIIGTDGVDGTDGVGVPAGGLLGQLLAKASGADFDTEWIDAPAGGGGGGGGNAPVAVIAYTDVDQAVANGGEIAVAYDAELYDTSALHSGANPSRLTISIAGYYLLHAGTEWSGGGGYVGQWFRKNGTTEVTHGSGWIDQPATEDPGLRSSVVAYLAAGDYVELMVDHFGDPAGVPPAATVTKSELGAFLLLPANNAEVAGFRAYRSTNQAIPAATFTTVVFDTEVRDQDNAYDPATGTFTVPFTGWYDVAWGLNPLALADQERFLVTIHCSVSGDVRPLDNRQGAAADANYSGSQPLYLQEGEQVQIWAWRANAGNVGPGSSLSWFSAVRLTKDTSNENEPLVARVHRTTNQSITTAVETGIQFNSVDFDDEAVHSVVGGVSRFTAKSAGTYEVIAEAVWTANPNGGRALYLIRNGTDYVGMRQMLNTGSWEPIMQVTTGPLFLAAGDYVELHAYHDAGATVDVKTAGFSPWMTIKRLMGVRAPGDPTISRVHRTTDQAVANNTEVGLSCDAVDFDDDGLHSVVGGISRFTIQRAGIYEFIGELVYDYHAGGTRDAFFKLNATDYRGVVQAPPVVVATDWQYLQCTSGPLELAAGDFVEFYAWQNSGAAVNLKADSGALSPWFSCKRADSISAAVSFMGASAWKNYPVNQAIPNAAQTPINWDAGDSGWWTAGDPSKLVVPPGGEGWYILRGRANWAGGGAGARELKLLTNGSYTETDRLGAALASDVTREVTSKPLYLYAGDYAQLSAYQTSGGAINIQGAPDWTSLALWRVGV